MNINSFSYFSAGTSQNQIAALTNAIAGTTETAISVSGNPFSGLGAGPMVLSVPSGIFASGKPFRIRTFGTVTTGTTTNVTLKLYEVPAAILSAGTAATLANDNSLGSTGAIAVNTASTNFILEAKLFWDATSQKLNGSILSQIGSSFVAEAAITPVTALASDSGLNFLLSCTFSASNAANVLQVTEFAPEVL